jgi:hypothetical protein
MGIEKKSKGGKKRRPSRRPPILDNVINVNNFDSLEQDINVEVFFRRTLSVPEFHQAIDAMISWCGTKVVPLSNNYVIQNDPINDDVDLYHANTASMLQHWCKWRVALEVAWLNDQIARTDELLKEQDLMLLAIANLDALVKIIRSKTISAEELRGRIAKLLGTDDAGARFILGLTLQRISRLGENEVQDRRRRLQAERRSLAADLKSPRTRLIRFLDEVSAS